MLYKCCGLKGSRAESCAWSQITHDGWLPVADEDAGPAFIRPALLLPAAFRVDVCP